MASLRGSNFISLHDFSIEQLRAVLDLAGAMMKDNAQRSLRHKIIASLFLHPSLQNRVALDAAAHQLGAHVVALGPGEPWSLATDEGKPMYGAVVEHVKDAAQSLSHQVDAIAIRALGKMENYEQDREDKIINGFVKYAQVPVINLGSAIHHPVQALSDLFTMERKLIGCNGRRITVAWTYHPKGLGMNTVNSLLLGAAKFGMHIHLAHPEGYELDPDLLDAVETAARPSGGSLKISHEFQPSFYNAEVVYCSSWAAKQYYGRAEQEKILRENLKSWVVDPRLMSLTRDASFMHALPIRRNIVATDEVIDAEYSLVNQQARNLLYVQKALLSLILDDVEYL